MDQPQVQLVQLGTEEQVHVLGAEGRRLFRAAPSCPRGGSARFPDASQRLLWFSDLADLRELQETLHALQTERRHGTVPATPRHLEDGLQPAEGGVREAGQTQEVGG